MDEGRPREMGSEKLKSGKNNLKMIIYKGRMYAC
jgi:hypothetical protein